MTFSQRVAITVPPIFLRLVLAITFLWAGLGKVLETAPFEGAAAARLANMGVQPEIADNTPPPLPDAVPDNLPDDLPDTLPEAHDTPEALEPEARAFDTTDHAFVRTQANPEIYTAADFPEPVQFKRVYGLALVVDLATTPPPAADGTIPPSFWPHWAGEGSWPVVLAWAAVATELLAAVLLLFGFLSRLAGLAVAGTMLSAAWLTQIGPALQSGDTALGFLPAYPAFEIAAWTPLLWQFSLFCAGMAVAFAGAGGLSLDRLSRRKNTDEDEEE
ncbi:MAG: DoxX family protein [Planctomycetota bacterium]